MQSLYQIVKESKYKGQKVFVCERCRYREKKWAKACEDWERKHKSCNIKIVAHAVK